MSEKIGNIIPPPLRFEMGAAEPHDSPVRAFLLVTVDQDDQPRVAVLSPTEIRALDERRLTVKLSDRVAHRAVQTSVAEVLRDFFPDAPMISGPTFRRLAHESV